MSNRDRIEALELTTARKKASCQPYGQFTAAKCPNGRWIIVKKRIDDIIIYKRLFISCQSYKCPVCRVKRRQTLYRMIKQACPKSEFSMLTLTLRKNSDTLEINWKRLSKSWDILIKRVKRVTPKVKYFRCVELQKNGMPHIHALINFYMPKWKIQKIWKDITRDSFICRFEKVDQSCAGYILKYFEKSINDIGYIRHATGKKTRIFNWSRLLLVFPKKLKEWELICFCKTNFEAIELLKSYCQSSRIIGGRVSALNIVEDRFGFIEKFDFRTVEC